ncbi:MAG: hypothetical protein AAFO82_13760 [Bacteroidota bacterium]
MMKMFLRWIHINPSIFSRLGASEKNLITILALSIPLSVIFTAFVFYYFFHFITEMTLISLVLGGFLAAFLFLHDSTMMGENGRTRAVARLVISAIIAVIAAIPLKVKFLGDSLSENYVATVNEYNSKIDEEIYDAQQHIRDEEERIYAAIKIASANYDKTGKLQELIEAKRIRDTFLVHKQEELQKVADLYLPKKKSLEPSKMDIASYFFTNMFNTASPKEMFGNLLIFVLLLFVEALPAGVRLKLEDGKYLSKIAHQKKMKDRTDDEVEQLEVSMLDLDKIEDLDGKLDEVSIWKEMEKASESGFQDTDKLKALVKAYKDAKNPPPPSEPAPVPASPTPQPIVPTNANPTPVNASANGFPEFDYSK